MMKPTAQPAAQPTAAVVYVTEPSTCERLKCTLNAYVYCRHCWGAFCQDHHDTHVLYCERKAKQAKQKEGHGNG